MKGLTLPQMRAIEAVARSGSFSGAAKQLGISQPSVSNHVTAVENRYRCKLLDRRGTSVQPTAELEPILSKIRSILLLVEELEQTLERKSTLETGQLRVGYSTYQIAVPILSRFMNRYPAVQVEARAMASHDLIGALDAGELDAICFTARELPSHLAGRKICDLRLVAAVPEGHALGQQTSVDLRDLVGQPLIQREKTSTTRRMFDAQAAVSRLDMTTSLAVGSWGTIIELVRGGVGLGIGLDREVVNERGVVAVPITAPVIHAAQYVAYLPERRMISTVQAFLALATEDVQDQPTS